VEVPITLTGLVRTEDVDLVVHYDPTLVYRGSFSLSNSALDLPAEQWLGRSKIRVHAATSDKTLGVARFDVFNDSLQKPQVWFDSVSVTSAIGLCQYLLPSPVRTSITPADGCAITVLSQYVHFGTVPLVSIRPNPTTGNVTLSTTQDMGEVEVVLYDMLGKERGRWSQKLAESVPVSLLFSVQPGLYYVQMKSAAGMRGVNIVVSK